MVLRPFSGSRRSLLTMKYYLFSCDILHFSTYFFIYRTGQIFFDLRQSRFGRCGRSLGYLTDVA